SNGTLRLSGTALAAGQTFTQADIDAGDVTYDHDGSQTTADSFDFTVDDGSGTDTSATFNFTVTNVNDAPVNTVPGAQTADEDTSIAITGISVGDADDNLSTVQLTVNDGVLSVSLSGAASISAGTNGSNDLTLSGSLADINATLASLTYQGDANFNGSDTLTVLSTDSNSDTDSDTVAITVNAVNDDPTDAGSLPNDISVTEDVLSNVDLSTVDFSDVDAASSNLTVTLFTSTGGELTLAADGSLTFGGTATSRTITGTLADLNSYFNNASSIQYLHGTPNINGDNADTITVVINDNGNTGSGGGADQTLGVVNVDIAAVNDTPAVTGPGSSYVVNEQTPLAIHGTGFSIADVDASSGLMTATLGVTEGAITIVEGDSGVTITAGNGSTGVTLTGTLAQINSLLTGSGTGTITYINNSDDPSTNATLQVTVNDGGNTGTDPGLTADASSEEDAASQVIVINAVNDAPVITNLAGDTLNYTEGDGAVLIEQGGNAVISDADSADFDGGTLTISLAAGSDPAEDVLAIRNQGTGAGQIGISGSNVTFGGTIIGSLTGGSGGSDLVITFNAKASSVGVTQVMQNVTYENTDTLSPTNGSRTVDFTVTDGDGGTSATQSATVNVSGSNDAPVLNLGPGGGTHFEGSSGTFVDASALISDVDSLDFDSGVLTTSITGNGESYDRLIVRDEGTGAGQVNVAGNSIRIDGVEIATFSGGIGAGDDLLITFDADADASDVQAVTRRVAFLSDSDNPSTAQRTISMTLTDGDGGTSATDTRVMNVVAVNDNPFNGGSIPTDVTVTEDVLSTVDLSAIEFDDLDDNGSDLTVTLSTSTGGELTLAADGSLTFGGTTTSRTITGTLADLNAYFDNASNIQYLHGTPNTNGDNADTITVVVNDNGNTGSGGGTDQNLGVVNVDIGAVNDAPVNTIPGTQVVAEETTTAISGISVADTDAATGSLTTRLQVANGVLNLTLNGSATISAGSNNSSDLTILGTQADINATLASLTYTGDTDVTGTNADNLIVTTDDQGNTGSGGARTDSDSIQIDITPINDEEVLSTNAGITVAEGSSGNTITTAMLETTDVDNANAALVYTVDGVVTSGTLRLNGTALSLSSTFTQADIDAGRLTYDHNGSEIRSDSFDFTVDDGSGTTSSGSFAISITNVNDAPTVTFFSTGGPYNYSENDGPVSTMPSLIVNDSDDTFLESAIVRISAGYNAAEDVLSFTDQNGITGSYNSSTGTWILTGTASVADYQTALRSITYTNTSENPDTTTRTLTYTVNDGDVDSAPLNDDIVFERVNDTPDVNAPASSYSVNEQTNLSIQGTGFSVNDVDATIGIMTATFTVGEGTLSLAAGDSGVTITSNNAGTVSFTGTLNQINDLLTGSSTGTVTYNNGSDTPSVSTTITLTVNDGGNTGTDPGLTADGSSEEDSASQTININPLNDDPTIANFDGDVLSYTEGDGSVILDQGIAALVGDVDSVDFAGGRLTVEFTAGSGGLEDQLGIRNQGAGPGQIGLVGSSLTFGGVVIGSVSGGSGGADLIINFNSFADSTAVSNLIQNLTYENTDQEPTLTDRTVQLTVTDGDGGTSIASQSTIQINAVNDAPTGVINNGLTTSEGAVNATIGTAQLSAIDPDDGPAGLTYTVTDDVDHGTLRLSGFGVLGLGDSFTQADVDAGLLTYDHDDSETTADAFSFTLADGGEDGAAAVSGTFAISVILVNDNGISLVTDVDAATEVVTENASVGTLLGITAFASDDDINDTISYSLIDDGGGLVSIDALSGVVSVASTIDFETAPNFDVTIEAASSDGSASSMTLNITVVDINEAPVAVDDQYQLGDSRTLTISGSGGLIFNDVDVDGDAVSTILVAGPSNGQLTIQAGGNFTYTPDVGFAGRDSFFYRLTDGTLLSGIAEVTIDVPSSASVGLPPDSGPGNDNDDPTSQTEQPEDDNPAVAPTTASSGDGTNASSSEGEGGSGVAAITIEQSQQSTGERGEKSFAIRVAGQQSGDSQDGDEATTNGILARYPQAYARDFTSQSSIVSTATLQLEQLLRDDLGQAIVWTNWNESTENEERQISVQVGVAGAGMAMVSVGYIAWALRGGAFASILSSSIPAWRFIDPVTMLSAYQSSVAKKTDDTELIFHSKTNE
ncbi:MAG: cadherin-like domain-containing protein, partial [Planctomycetota bacterium]